MAKFSLHYSIVVPHTIVVDADNIEEAKSMVRQDYFGCDEVVSDFEIQRDLVLPKECDVHHDFISDENGEVYYVD